MFQCPEIENALEAKELYEQRTGRKVIRPAALTTTTQSTGPGLIKCLVNQSAETFTTPDTGAEVTIVTLKLLNELKTRRAWIASQEMLHAAAVTGITGKPVPVKTKLKLDLTFSTLGGPLVLQNVVCWVATSTLPDGMGDLLLSRPVMERLG